MTAAEETETSWLISMASGYMSQEDNKPDGHLLPETLAVSQSSVPSEETLRNLSCLKWTTYHLTLLSSLIPRPTDHNSAK